MPTKEEVIEVLAKGITQITEIKSNLNCSRKDLLAVLNILEAEGLIYARPKSGTYGLLKEGKVQIKAAGYGFITCKENSYYVYKDQLNHIYDGDTLLFYPYAEGKKLLAAQVLKVVARYHSQIIGYVVVPKHKPYKLIRSNMPNFLATAVIRDSVDLVKNQIVIADLNYTKSGLEAFNVQLIGNPDTPGVEISQIALEYGFKAEFEPEVYEEASLIPQVVEKTANRRDFTSKLIFTIDGATAKDFDDAVSLEMDEEGNYHLGVYIADVAEYVLEDSALDKSALKRGTSVYLADRVIPMLPIELSNGICSLNPHVDRLVLALQFVISPKGKLLDYEICEGIINSKYRLTYDEVNSFLATSSEDYLNDFELGKTLRKMVELSEILRSLRRRKGALEFNISEYKFVLNSDGTPKSIVKRTNGLAEKLIEDFMLLANETVAYNLAVMNYPCIYRIHEKPDQEKLAAVINNLMSLDVFIKRDKKGITPKNLQELLEALRGNSLEELINSYLLRGMMKAKYSELCLGHYALAMNYYCHFTSPIRRYPDLEVHRIIKRLVLHPDNLASDLEHFTNIAADIASQTSNCEKRAIECERAVDDMLSAWYMESNIRKIYKANISAVTKFGIFAKIAGGIEGFISLDDLYGYYDYDAENMCYTKGNTSYHLGDEVEVVVIAADRHSRQIDLMFLKDYRIYYGE